MTNLFQAYLACSVTIAAVTGVLFALSPWLGKRYKARTLYIAWLVALLGFLVPLRLAPTPPALTAQIPAAMERPVFAAANAAVPALGAGAALNTGDASAMPMAAGDARLSAPAAAIGETAIAKPAKPLTWLTLAALIWLLGAAGTLAIFTTRHALFLRTVRRWQKPFTHPQALAILEAERRRLKIRRPVALLLCPSVNSPMMIGLKRPRLLLPDGDLTADEMPLVFRHELTHFCRRDLWVKAALLLAISLHWFNPAVYALARTLGFWQEASCDEKVTAAETQDGKQFYSETIIRVIRRQTRMKSLMTTSFYSGKSGMKRRILAILQNGGKRAGTAVCLATLVAVSSLGMAFAVSPAPEIPKNETEPALAYVTRSGAEGAPMVFSPSINDLNLPLAAYFNGVPVTIVKKTASSSLKEWGYREGEPNWAYVLVGGEGILNGISGWIPLYYLSETPAALPTATLSTASPTGHVNIYALNDVNSTLINAFEAGTRVTLLGRVQKWYQIELNGVYGFVPRDNLTIDEATQARFDTFLPNRFDTIERAEYQRTLTFGELYAQKAAEYGGKGVENWSLEDKAWYGQMEETYVGAHDHYYQLPQEGDLQKDAAVDIAWDAFITDCQLPDAKREDYDFNLGFYSIPNMNTVLKRWQIEITRKGGDATYRAVLASPGGEILDRSGAEMYFADVWRQADEIAYQAMAEWEQERGKPYGYWPLEDKAAFDALYWADREWRTLLPDDGAIPQAKAEELARSELNLLYSIPMEEMLGWKISVSYKKDKSYNDMSPYWYIEFFDASDNSQSVVLLDAYTGDVFESYDPRLGSNG